MPESGAVSGLSSAPCNRLRRKSYLGTPSWGTMLARALKGLSCSVCMAVGLILTPDFTDSESNHIGWNIAESEFEQLKQVMQANDFDEKYLAWSAGPSQKMLDTGSRCDFLSSL